jgi:phosphate-selective porin OprO/OprP
MSFMPAMSTKTIHRYASHGALALLTLVPSLGVADDAVQRSPGSAEIQALEERIRKLEAERTAAKEPAKPAEGSVPRIRVADGLVLEDPDGKWSVRATARGMADYRDFLDTDAKADTFSLRRARIGLGFTVNRELTGFLESEMVFGASTQSGTPASAGLLQGFLEYAPSPKARIRLGQFKPQFMLESTMSPFHVDFQERSLMFNLLQNFLYDRGVMLHGAPFAGTYYGVSITNGTGINLDEFQRNGPEGAASSKDVTLRLVGNAATWMSLENTVLHFGGSYKTGTLANGDATSAGYAAANGLTEDRGLVFFNPLPFNAGSAAASRSIDRTIGAVEGALSYRQFKLQGEYAQANYNGTLQGGQAFDRGISSGYLSASWLVTGESFAEFYRNGVFGRIVPRSPFSTAGGGTGAIQLSGRYSFFDGADFTATNPANSGVLGGNTLAPAVTQSTTRADAYTLALKWMPTAHVAVMLNYVRTEFDSPIVVNGQSLDRTNSLTLRGQFDFF